MVSILKPATLNLSFAQDRRVTSVSFKELSPPVHGLQTWFYEMTVLEPDSKRMMSGAIHDVPVPGSWNHLTARFFAMYPDLDMLNSPLGALGQTRTAAEPEPEVKLVWRTLTYADVQVGDTIRYRPRDKTLQEQSVRVTKLGPALTVNSLRVSMSNGLGITVQPHQRVEILVQEK